MSNVMPGNESPSESKSAARSDLTEDAPLRGESSEPNVSSNSGCLRSRMIRWALILIALLWIGAVAHLRAAWRSQIGDFWPINGDFQTFNPAERWLSGERFGVDFDAYLGLGPTALSTAAIALAGGSYGPSLYAVSFLCVFLAALAAMLIARLAQAKPLVIACSGVLVAQAIFPRMDRWLPRPCRHGFRELWTELVLPGNSLLGLRYLIAILIAAAVGLWFRNYLLPDSALSQRGTSPQDLSVAGSRQRLNWNTGWLSRSLLFGVLAGMAFPWSNDFGPTTAAALIATVGLCSFRDLSWPRWILAGLIVTGLTALACGVLMAAVTIGHPEEWFRYNFIGVAGDQAWYFLGVKVFFLRDVLRTPSFWVGLIAVLILLIDSRRFPFQASSPLFLIVMLSSWLSMSLRLLGGNAADRIFYPLWFSLLLITPYLAQRLLLSGLVWLRSRRNEQTDSLSTAAQMEQWSTLPHWQRSRCVTAVTLLVIQSVALVSLKHPLLTPVDPIVQAQWFRVPELDCSLSEHFSKLDAIGREWKEEFDRQGLPAHGRSWSTYRSAIERIVGAAPDVPDDYLIHALGSQRRAQHTDRFIATAPRRVSTIRLDLTHWEQWLRHENWDFYRELITRYEPCDRSIYHLHWEPRKSPLVPPAVTATVDFATLHPNQVELTLRVSDETGVMPAPPQPTDADRKTDAMPDLARPPDVQDDIIVEVELEYATARSANFLTRRALQQFLMIVDLERYYWFNDAQDQMKVHWGLPLGEHRVRFPVELPAGSQRKLLVWIRPDELSRVEVKSVSARPMIRKRDIDDWPLTRLRASRWTDADWDRGIGRPGTDLASDPLSRSVARSVGNGDHPPAADQAAQAPVSGDNHSIPVSRLRVSDPTDLVHLRAGDELDFPSGRRQIVAIEDKIVFVSGPPLDADRDGYPHPIRVTEPRRRRRAPVDSMPMKQTGQR